jgi:predicted transposase YdaD
LSEVKEKEPVFQQVLKAEKDYWGDSRNRFLQMLEERAERDRYSELYAARTEGRLEGRAEGLQEGEKRGEARGLSKGIAQGRTEGRIEGHIDAARALLAEQTPVDLIQKVTGLSAEEINSLRLHLQSEDSVV